MTTHQRCPVTPAAAGEPNHVHPRLIPKTNKTTTGASINIWLYSNIFNIFDIQRSAPFLVRLSVWIGPLSWPIRFSSCVDADVETRLQQTAYLVHRIKPAHSPNSWQAVYSVCAITQSSPIDLKRKFYDLLEPLDRTLREIA